MTSERRHDRSAFCTLRSAFRVGAFTLIEMLTVLAIIGILAAILIPAIRVALQRARIAQATHDVAELVQATTAYNLDFGAFPPDATAFWTNPQGLAQPDSPFPGFANGQLGVVNQVPLNPNELLMWYLTMQYSTGQWNPATGSYPAVGYPDGYGYKGTVPTPTYNAQWPSTASVVFSRSVNSQGYFSWKSKQRTDYNQNGFSEFVDPWGRPYMYRAYPQVAQVVNVLAPVQPNPPNGPWQVTLTLNDLFGPTTCLVNGVTYPAFDTNTNFANLATGGKTVGTIQLSAFTTAAYNATFSFTGASSNQIIITFPTNPGVTNIVTGTIYGYCTFPLHNQQTCDIYCLGPYGMTRGASMPGGFDKNGNWVASEWKPTHGGSSGATATTPWLDPTSLDAWIQVWGTSGDGNDISSTTGNVIVNPQFQDNIPNW